MFKVRKALARLGRVLIAAAAGAVIAVIATAGAYALLRGSVLAGNSDLVVALWVGGAGGAIIAIAAGSLELGRRVKYAAIGSMIAAILGARLAAMFGGVNLHTEERVRAVFVIIPLASIVGAIIGYFCARRRVASPLPPRAPGRQV
jgi:hypothetical protein